MKITEIINAEKPSLSFEVFPPKTTDKYEIISQAVQDIAALNPSYISVTYGAGGGTSQYTSKIRYSQPRSHSVRPETPHPPSRW